MTSAGLMHNTWRGCSSVTFDRCTLGQASFEVRTKRSYLEPVLTGRPEAGPSCGSCDSLHRRKMAAEGGAWIILGRTNSISGFFVSRGRTPGLGGRLHTYSFRQSNTEQDGSAEESECAKRDAATAWCAEPRVCDSFGWVRLSMFLGAVYRPIW